MKLLRIIGPLALGAQICVAASVAEIEWSPARPLTWDDFQGSVPRGADESRVAATLASIAWTYEYRVEWSPTSCRFGITRLRSRALFDPERSWSRSDHRTDAVLQHEQGHFDIAQVYNERFREATADLIGAYRECNATSQRRATQDAEREIGRIVGEIYDEIWQAYDDRQATYDRETRHGIDRELQDRWTRTIADELD